MVFIKYFTAGKTVRQRAVERECVEIVVVLLCASRNAWKKIYVWMDAGGLNVNARDTARDVHVKNLGKGTSCDLQIQIRGEG